MKNKIKPEVYSRTVGYFRPVDQWNKGKQEEFKDRYTQNPNKLVKKLNAEV
jgi:anaerobic ribonucleoside-triphosphate reductase